MEAFSLTSVADLLELDPAEDNIAHHRADSFAHLTMIHDKHRNTRGNMILGGDKTLVAEIRGEAMTNNERRFAGDANLACNGRRFFCTS